jgi:hypothetical protein
MNNWRLLSYLKNCFVISRNGTLIGIFYGELTGWMIVNENMVYLKNASKKQSLFCNSCDGFSKCHCINKRM